MLFLADGTCWGAAGMVRRGHGFADRETEFLAAVAPAVATATRLAVRSEASVQIGVGHPAIVIVGPQGELGGHTGCPGVAGPARRDARGRFVVMMQVMASGARTASSGGFRARLRDARGQWAVLEASR